MVKNCHKTVSISLTSVLRRALAPLLSLTLAAVCHTAAAAELQPHSAVYHSSTHGLSIDLDQTLKKLDDSRWRLHNHSGLLFVDVDETATFAVDGTSVQPLRYDFDNELSKKRSSHLRFDWNTNTVTEELHGDKPMPVQPPIWDSLSFQAQLRLDLMREGENFQQRIYPQVVRDRVKFYSVTRVGDGVLKTPLGTFNIVKLEQRRLGKEDYTSIWLARDWDYLVLRLQRFEDGDAESQLDLKSAVINDRRVTGMESSE